MVTVFSQAKGAELSITFENVSKTTRSYREKMSLLKNESPLFHDRLITSLYGHVKGSKRQRFTKAATAKKPNMSNSLLSGFRGITLTFNMTKEKVYVKACWFVDALGNRCGNRGISVDILENLLLDEIKKYNDNYLISFRSEDNERAENMQALILEKEAVTEISKSFRACKRGL